MKLIQLQSIIAIAQSDLSITAAATTLDTTQPALSKQLRLIERELGFTIFTRDGRSLGRVTPAGERVLGHARRVIQEVGNIERISADYHNDRKGTLSIGTTHAQARYVLPPVVQAFRHNYPQVQFNLHQGTLEQVAALVRANRIDLAIATGAEHLGDELTLLPCYRWALHIVVPASHPLANEERPALEQLARYPLVTYAFSDEGATLIHQAFAAEGLTPNIAITAWDADVVKTYVRLGFGVGIIASMAVERGDADLFSFDASHLFGVHTTWAGFAKGRTLRRYAHHFLTLLAPHLSRASVERAAVARTPAEAEGFLAELVVPVR